MILLAFPILALVLVAAAVGVHWVRIACRLRQRFRIPAAPTMTDTQAEHVPPELAAFVARVAPELERAGFTAAASVHAPELAHSFAWTQVLFLNRPRGDRASIMCLRRSSLAEAAESRGPTITLAFATELPDGRSVRTPMQESQPD